MIMGTRKTTVLMLAVIQCCSGFSSHAATPAKSVADMTVEELQSYLNSGKKSPGSGGSRLDQLIAAARDFRNPSAGGSANKLYSELGALSAKDVDVVPSLLQVLNEPMACYEISCATICKGETCASTCMDAFIALSRKQPLRVESESSLTIKDVKSEYKSPFCRRSLIDALGRIGPGAKSAAPVLVSMLDEKPLRCYAAFSLGNIRLASRAVISGLTKSLRAGNYCAASALGQFGPKAKVAVPALLEALKKAAVATELEALESESPSMNDKHSIATALIAIGTPEARAAATRFKNKRALQNHRELVRYNAAEAAKEAAKKKHKIEFAHNWLKSQPWSAGEVLHVAGDCMAAEGNMRAHAQAARGSIEITGAAPSRRLIQNYETAASEGAARCETFTTEYGDYLNQYGDDGYAYLWRYCEEKYGAGPCLSFRSWMKRHR